MRVAITGSSGLVGSAVVSSLRGRGDEVVRLVRKQGGSGTVLWDPAAGTIDESGLEGVDAVVHLAGENIASGRWTPARKEAIRRSRADGTRLLSTALARLVRPPKVLVSASAVGYYGDRGAELLDEQAPKGVGFLPDVCEKWEKASLPAREKGIRVAWLRIGVVLSRDGGALAKMLLPFRLGLGGKVGSGAQYMSWISLPDLVAVIGRALGGTSGISDTPEASGTTDTRDTPDSSLSGPVNAVAPNAVTNLEFTKTLGRVLGRPTMASVPAFAARLVLGEMADELLLASARVEPSRLRKAGHRFLHPELEGALRAALGA